MAEPLVTPGPRELAVIGAGVAVAFVAFGVAPEADRLTWLMENAPVLIAAPVLLATGRRFPLTRLAYWLIGFHALVLMLGGHYTYAEVPLGHWVRDALDLSRNHYDRVGHFVQGFVPAIVVREVLVRRTALRPGGWTFTIVTFMCLGFSALYELVEWWAAALTEDGATAFLGTQGDPWDTQWDMFLCGAGAAVSQLTLGRIHDRQLGPDRRVPSAAT
jgi:putative membrane protein